MESDQEQIFNETAKPILESVMQGYNGTIFAYGQTGTGKTYTMEGTDKEGDKGIIPRSIELIFSNIKNYTNQQFLVRGSFVEIYNEKVRDLLSKNTKAKMSVREKDKVFYLEDVTIYQAENAQKMIDNQPLLDIVNEVNNILTDDDNDLIYYVQSIHIITPILNPGIVDISDKKVDSKNSTTDSNSSKKFVAPVIKKKK